MKYCFIFLLLCFSSISFGTEITSECIMMRETSLRNNPKTNLMYSTVRSKSNKNHVTSQ